MGLPHITCKTAEVAKHQQQYRVQTAESSETQTKKWTAKCQSHGTPRITSSANCPPSHGTPRKTSTSIYRRRGTLIKIKGSKFLTSRSSNRKIECKLLSSRNATKNIQCKLPKSRDTYKKIDCKLPKATAHQKKDRVHTAQVRGTPTKTSSANCRKSRNRKSQNINEVRHEKQSSANCPKSLNINIKCEPPTSQNTYHTMNGSSNCRQKCPLTLSVC